MKWHKKQSKMDKKEILEYFNGKFGTCITSRMRKLEEEFKELKEESESDAFKEGESYEGFVDELADLNGVLFHIAGILGFSQDDLLAMCVDKVRGREKDPNYKRKHPHVRNIGAE